MCEIEQWRQIAGYEGYYEVSSLGNIRSVTRWVKHPTGSQMLLNGRPIRTELNAKGYVRVQLCRDGIRRRFLVHQLALTAFEGPRPANMVSRHYNDIKADNRIENLLYGTESENSFDRVRNCEPKSSCAQGHEYTPENTKWRDCKSRGRYRVCKACYRIWRDRINEKSRASRKAEREARAA